MKVLVTASWTSPPYGDIQILSDRYVADGVIYYKSVIGTATIQDWVSSGPSPEIPPAEITRLQFTLGALGAGLITSAEAESFASGNAIPAILTAAINALPADQRAFARIKVNGMKVVERNNPLLILLMSLVSPAITPAQMDAYFVAWSKIT